MVSKKTTVAPTDLSSLLKFDPKLFADPVPWEFLHQLDRSIFQQAMQVQLELHETLLQARLDATKRLNKVIRGK
ncbi:MAG TPA: hypothetical protein VM934_11595 [Pyrinomonadaceae bacterium]|jgi:hypothetical protein|nr:hypothetical protein [Pyrinomonadaceae bacterium]